MFLGVVIVRKNYKEVGFFRYHFRFSITLFWFTFLCAIWSCLSPSLYCISAMILFTIYALSRRYYICIKYKRNGKKVRVYIYDVKCNGYDSVTAYDTLFNYSSENDVLNEFVKSTIDMICRYDRMSYAIGALDYIYEVLEKDS